MEFASSKIKIIFILPKIELSSLLLFLYVRREISELKRKTKSKTRTTTTTTTTTTTKNKNKKTLGKSLLYFGKWNFLAPPEKLIKLCYAQNIFMFMIKLSKEKVDACVRPHLVASPSLCSPCVTYGTPCHSIGCQVLPKLFLPSEANDFSRGGKHFNHVPLLT